MRELSNMEILRASGGDDLDTCEALGDVSGLLAEYLIYRRVGVSPTTLVGAETTQTATSSGIDAVCLSFAEWLGDGIFQLDQSLTESLREAGEYLELFNYYDNWGSTL